jgi:hypothetical protein
VTWLCLALALAFAAPGLLAVFRAPTFSLFFVAVGATHAFDYNMSGPGGQVAAACLEAFLGRVSGSDRV